MRVRSGRKPVRGGEGRASTVLAHDAGVDNEPSQATPIVLCPGFLGPAKEEDGGGLVGGWREGRRMYDYWGEATKLGTAASPVLCVWPGGLSSLHDRACEIFYQLKGGCVDYGADHSAQFGHARFGRTYRGLHPAWSDVSPIHVIGHSLGGTTVRMLQVVHHQRGEYSISFLLPARALRPDRHLLHVRAFPGHNTSAEWIVSLTAISAPLNGELAAYALGEEEASAPDVVSWSPGSFLGSLVHVLAFTGWRIGGFDLGIDQWELSWRGRREGRSKRSWEESAKCLWAALNILIVSIFIRSPLVESEDNAAYDASVHAMAKCNALIGVAHDCTFYLSLVGTGEDANEVPHRPHSTHLREWLQWLLLAVQFCFRRVFLSLICFITHRLSYKELEKSLQGVEGFAVAHYLGCSTDGLCSVYTQNYPRIGVAHEPWRARAMPATAAEMTRGVWHIETHGQDHMGLVPFPVSLQVQRKTFERLFQRLRSLPVKEAAEARGKAVQRALREGTCETLPLSLADSVALTQCPSACPSLASSEASDTETELSLSSQHLDKLLADELAADAASAAATPLRH